MMIPMGELLAKAKKEGYGVAAPNDQSGYERSFYQEL